MKNYIKEGAEKMNAVTKIFIGIFFILAIVYLSNKFYDTYRLKSPVIFQNPIERRYPTSSKPKKSADGQKKGQKTAIKAINPAMEAIYIYFGNDPVAYSVARAEAGLTCHKTGYNTNGTVDRGLFQINSIHDWRFKKFGGDPFDCWDNAKVARQIYDEQNWYPWSVYQNKSYLTFLK